jgi:hypothetical protein
VTSGTVEPPAATSTSARRIRLTAQWTAGAARSGHQAAREALSATLTPSTAAGVADVLDPIRDIQVLCPMTPAQQERVLRRFAVEMGGLV